MTLKHGGNFILEGIHIPQLTMKIRTLAAIKTALGVRHGRMAVGPAYGVVGELELVEEVWLGEPADHVKARQVAAAGVRQTQHVVAPKCLTLRSYVLLEPFHACA